MNNFKIIVMRDGVELLTKDVEAVVLCYEEPNTRELGFHAFDQEMGMIEGVQALETFRVIGDMVEEELGAPDEDDSPVQTN